MKSLYLSSLALLVAAACGDNHDNKTPDANATPDVAVTPDAKPCDVAGYPMPIKRLSVDLGAEFDLALDGQGDRCDQIIRALTDADPTKRPPELAQLDVVGVTGTCTYDDVLQRDIVRLKAPLYGGLPLYGDVVQDVLVHVGHPTMANVIGMPATVVYLHGDFLPAGKTTNAACFDATQTAASVPGRAMTYGKFDACTYQGDGSYTVASTDTVEVNDEGYMVDADGHLRRVRGVDVYLLPGNVTPEVANSDAFCCGDTSLDHCVGQKLLIDVVTGEVVGQMHHCHTC